MKDTLKKLAGTVLRRLACRIDGREYISFVWHKRNVESMNEYIERTEARVKALEDRGLVITGEDAKVFLANMEDLDRTGNSPEKQAFLEECSAIYRKYKAQLDSN